MISIEATIKKITITITAIYFSNADIFKTYHSDSNVNNSVKIIKADDYFAASAISISNNVHVN